MGEGGRWIVFGGFGEPFVFLSRFPKVAVDEPLDFVGVPFQGVDVESFGGVLGGEFVGLVEVGVAGPWAAEMQGARGFVNGAASGFNNVDFAAGCPATIF